MIYDADDILKGKALCRELSSKIQGRACYGNYGEIIWLLRQQMGDSCSRYLEIGTFFGGSMLLAMQHPEPCHFTGVDPFAGFYGHAKDKISGMAPNLTTVIENIELNNPHQHRYRLVKGNSHDPVVKNEIVGIHDEVDLLFLDGDHTKPGLTQDFQDYLELVRPGGVVHIDNWADRVWPGVTQAVQAWPWSGWTWLGTYGKSITFQRDW